MPRTKNVRQEQEAAKDGASQTVKALLRLRELVLSGEYAPGQRMAEIQLAARLDVSRTPLRLALSRLEHEGLLELHATRGFIVRAFTLTDVYDSIELRGVLEGTAARMAAERWPLNPALSVGAMEELRQTCAKLDVLVRSPAGPLKSFESYIELNERFHFLLLKLAQSDVLSREIDRVVRLPFASATSGFLRMHAEIPESGEILVIAQDQHRSILDAIETHQGARAEALAREHARIARRNLDIVLKNTRIRHLVPGISLLRNPKTDASSPRHAAAGKIATMPLRTA